MYFFDNGKADLCMAPWTFITYDLTKNERLADWLKQQPFQWVIADECHMIKGMGSQRKKSCITTTRHISNRLGLTGSMIGNDPIDVLAQCEFVDGGKLFGTDPWAFKQRYYIENPQKTSQGGDYTAWYLRRGAKQQIREKLAQLAYSVHEDDVLDLPPVRRLYKAVPLSKAQQRLYDSVIEEWEYKLASGEIVEIDYVIVQVAKLRQIASGFLYGPPPEKKAEWVRSSKLELYLDMLQDPAYFSTKSKLVTWCAHTAEIERIADELPTRDRVLFYGKMNRTQREQARKDFQSRDRVRYFVGQVDAGMGMNELICADTAVYFSNSRRVISRLQSERRTRRKGSEIHKTITYYDLLSEKSIDTHIAKDLTGKMDIAAYILKQLKQGHSLRSLVQ